ncbi:MAG: ATP-dependent protease ATPase subunit HslU [Planctomycetota bacterium]
MNSFTPKEIVEKLDKHIVGQAEAKRAVAVAIRNRWRRQQLADEMRQEVSPKNILMIGSTGVGKTEIARRLAKLTGAPFIKVEATKYTEVGYYGRDVESMVRELVDNAITLVKATEKEKVTVAARERTENRLVELLCPNPTSGQFEFPGSQSNLGNSSESDQDSETVSESFERTRGKFRKMLQNGELEDRNVEITIEQKVTPVMMGGMGVEQMDVDFQGMLEKIIPSNRSKKDLKVSDARKVIFEQEVEALLDTDKINLMAIELAENSGIIFLDEIDKVVATEGKSADVSRQGVQRDLLPIVEGTTIQTKHGYIKTDHILFVAAGAFHTNQPSDLMPELQGRFPIRVELNDLTREDFIRILTEPKSSLTTQYQALMKTEGVQLDFEPDGIEALAEIAFRVNQQTMNIGARRLYTIMEHLLEELSFEAPEMKIGKVAVNAAYVQDRLGDVAQNEDLSRYIL